MKIYRRSISYTTLLALLFSFHLCACEEALATAQVDESCGHHESNGGHSHDSNSEDQSSCCSKIVAVQNSAKVLDSTGSQLFSKGYWKAGAPDTFINTDLLLIKHQQFEFPPGASPPGVFLSSHFTHAPPTSL